MIKNKKRVRSITFTVLTESPVALSNDQGTGGNFTPIKKYFYKDGMRAMTSVATFTYELKKILYTNYEWKLNSIIVKDKNLTFRPEEMSNKEADVFGFLIPDLNQASKTSPLRIIPFISVNIYRNDTQLITNRGFLNKNFEREYYKNEKNEMKLMDIKDVKETNALANEEIMGDYYYYTVTLELDRIGKTELDKDGKMLNLKEQQYFEKNIRKEIVSDLINALSELTRDIKHQTVHLKPIAVYGGIFKKVIPYFWNDVKFEDGKLNVDIFNKTVEDYRLFEEGKIIAAVDEERFKNEINGDLTKIKGKRPVAEMKEICKMIEDNKLFIGEDNFWYLED